MVSPNPENYPILTERESLLFLDKVRFVDGHLMWTASSRNGYGQFRIRGRTAVSHVLAWVQDNGPVPPGMEMGHTCEFTLCLLHVRPVTHKENINEGAVAQKHTHCNRGHPLVEGNISTGSSGRRCRICVNARQRGYRKKDS